MGKILVGISSWTEKTLIEGGHFYPLTAKSPEARLRFYATQFPLVEVDATYYAMPEEKTADLWVNRTPTNFTFNIKAFRLFTQHGTALAMLPPEIRNQVPQRLKDKKNFYYRDLPEEITSELWRLFAKALLPLDSAGKLGVVLFQFPPWFMPSHETLAYMAFCKEKLPQYHIAVEFRHWSWLNDKNLGRTMDLLKAANITYVCVDEPQGFNNSVPPIVEATSDIGVVRFHGRNTKDWEKPSQAASGRFNYLYSEDELKEWVPRIKELSLKTKLLHVVFNNCYDDKAIRNARQMGLISD